MTKRDFPLPHKEAEATTRHNDTRVDNYAWLREQASPETQAYLNELKAHHDNVIRPLKPAIKTIYDEICSRIQLDDTTVPLKVDDYWYYDRTLKNSDYEIILRKPLKSDVEEIILNIDELAKPYEYFDLASYEVSPDHRYLAFCIDFSGDEQYQLFILDLEKKCLLPERFHNCSTEFSWDKSSTFLYYITLDNKNRPSRCMLHQLYTRTNEDMRLYEEYDERYFLSIHLSKSEEFIFLLAGSNTTTECWYIKQDDVSTLHRSQGREAKRRYYLDHHQDYFYCLTNEAALNFKVQRCQIDGDTWEDFIEHTEDATLESFELMKDYLVVEIRQAAQVHFEVLRYDLSTRYQVEFPEDVYSISFDENVDLASNTLRFNYESMLEPASVFDLNLDTNEKVCLKQDKVLGHYNPDDYRSERIYATAPDGTEIPISLVYKKSEDKTPRPVYLYGYGAYGENLDPWFSYARFSLLDRGVIFAIAHVRGGADCGESWHLDGKMAHKTNSFNDLKACIEYLIQENYTDNTKVAISGGSAGGLLVGATANLVPELLSFVIADVPFVDVLNTMLDDSLPLTVGEYEEWGNPNKQEDYLRIKSYCPYTNVQPGKYPDFYITVGIHDTRVPYWEGVKWAAKLKELNPTIDITVKCNDDAGHSGSTGRFSGIREIAEEFAIFLNKFELL